MIIWVEGVVLMIRAFEVMFDKVRDFIIDGPRGLVISLLGCYFAVVSWALITYG